MRPQDCSRMVLVILISLFLTGCRTPRLSYFGPNHVYRTTTAQVLLSFDDGPTENTLQILDILEDHDVTAAFFLRGDRALQNPDIVSHIAAGGHIIGNHSFSHIKLTDVPMRVGAAEILRTQDALGQFGQRRWFRPPYGELPYDLSQWLESEGFTVVRWSSVSYSNLRPGDILLLHESDEVVDELPTIITAAEAASGPAIE